MAGRFAISTVIRAVDQVSRPMRRMTRTVTRAAAAMGRAFKGLTKTVGRLATGLAKAGISFTKFAALGVTGLTTGVTLLNAATVEAEQLAKAVGVSTDLLEGLAAAVAPAGFNLDNVNSLIEEMNNKLGESVGLAQTLPVQESLKILGLQFRDLKKLSPEEQFRAISDAILRMQDNAQAVSAADILFGGEANRIFGVLRATGMTLDEIVGQYKELNFQTDASRRGASKFTQQFTRLKTVVSTLAKFIAGLVGDAMAPLIDSVIKWTSENRELIRTGVIEFLESFAGFVKRVFLLSREAGQDQSFINNIKALGAVLSDVGSFFKEFGPSLSTVVSVIFKAIGVISKLLATIIVGWRMLFEELGGLIGRSLGAVVIQLEKWWGRISPRIDAIMSRVRGVGEFLGLVDEQPASSGGVTSSITTPGERTANLLEEKKTTNTTEVVLRDTTGKAEVTKGGKNMGFNLISTGAL